ncbi:MAG: hypothetical protein PHV39_10415 [Methanomicrobium sp.]|nr:hypothetical protein [Methanomicrobium sp.]
MKKLGYLVGIILCLLAALSVAGCMGPDPIVGYWKEYTIPLVSIESTFYEDGTFMFSVNGIGTDGKWTSKGNRLYDLDFGIGNPITGRVSEDGKTLSFEYEILGKTVGLSLEKVS